MRIKRLLWLYMLLLFSAAGCINVTLTLQQPDGGPFQILLLSNTQPPVSLAPTATPVPATETPLPSPTSSPTPTSTPTPTETAVLTPTPLELLARTRLDTRCRIGPGVSYRTLTYLAPGVELEILGRNLSADWWLVQPEDSAACWVSSCVTDFSGDPSLIPVVTAPPSPTSTGSLPGDGEKPGQPRPTTNPPPTRQPTDTPEPTEPPYPPVPSPYP